MQKVEGSSPFIRSFKGVAAGFRPSVLLVSEGAIGQPEGKKEPRLKAERPIDDAAPGVFEPGDVVRGDTGRIGAEVPMPGHGVSVDAVTDLGGGVEFQVETLEDGTVVVGEELDGSEEGDSDVSSSPTRATTPTPFARAQTTVRTASSGGSPSRCRSIAAPA